MVRHALAFVLASAACSGGRIDVLGPGRDAGPGVLPRSCREVLSVDPNAPDGLYALDPDGVGDGGARTFACDMSGGGWTQVVDEPFTARNTLFPGVPLGQCGGLGTQLGGPGVLGRDQTLTATLPLAGVPHSEARVAFHFFAFDSWDGELAFLDMDGVRAWMLYCEKANPEACGQLVQHCGSEALFAPDGFVPVEVVRPHTADRIELRFGAVLDQSLGDESWGLGALTVAVR